MGCASGTQGGNPAQVSPECNGVAPPVKTPEKQDFHQLHILGTKLGRGAFAQVRCVTLADKDADQKENAVKILDLRDKDKPDTVSPNLMKGVKLEASVWKLVGNHQNCIRLYEVFIGEWFCYMVMEKCRSGLLQAFESMPALTERGLGNIFAQMLLGISHCHSVKVVHRDIKPDNFLVDGQTIKLGDFGLSAVLGPKGTLSGIFGTAPFMCPEMLGGFPYNEKSDVWSFAVVVYVLLLGTFPYLPKQQSSKHMKQAILEGKTEPSFQPVQTARTAVPGSGVRSDDAIDFIKTLLARDPQVRPSAEDALSMKWMSSAMQACHVPGQELPSLRPTLHSARKCGAFEVRNPTILTTADALLGELQMQYHGLPLPVAPNPADPPKKKVRPGSKDGAKDSWENGSNPSNASDLGDNMSVFSGSIFSGWSKGTEQLGSTGSGAPP